VEINSEVPRVHGSARPRPDSASQQEVQRHPRLEFHVKQHRTASTLDRASAPPHWSDDGLSRGPLPRSPQAGQTVRPARRCHDRSHPHHVGARIDLKSGACLMAAPCPAQPKYTASVTARSLRACQSPDRATPALPASPDRRPHGARLAVRSDARKLTAHSHVQRWPPARIDTRNSDRLSASTLNPAVTPAVQRSNRENCDSAYERGVRSLHSGPSNSFPESRPSRVDGFRSVPVRWRRPHHSAPSVETAINELRDRRLCRSPAGPPGRRFFQH
jgi:hypothetical protein